MSRFIGVLMSLYIFVILSISLCAHGQTEATATAGDPAVQDFLSQVLTTIKNIGGVKTMVAISMVLTLIVSSMKVSILNQLIWSKLGTMKVFVAPVLALVAGLLGLGASGQPVTAALVLAYLSAGGGAVFLHEILDSLKAIPGLGPMYLSLIYFMESLLGGPQKSK